MKPNKVYYLSDGSRTTFVILVIVVITALLFFLKMAIDEFELVFKLESFISFFGGLICLNLLIKGIKKVYILIKNNVPIIELYDTYLIVALYPGGRFSNTYKVLFGKYAYSKIHFKNIESIYRNKKLIRTDYSRVHGYTFIKGEIDNKQFDVPTLIGTIGSSNYINMKIWLDKQDFDTSKLI